MNDVLKVFPKQTLQAGCHHKSAGLPQLCCALQNFDHIDLRQLSFAIHEDFKHFLDRIESSIEEFLQVYEVVKEENDILYVFFFPIDFRVEAHDALFNQRGIETWVLCLREIFHELENEAMFKWPIQVLNNFRQFVGKQECWIKLSDITKVPEDVFILHLLAIFNRRLDSTIEEIKSFFGINSRKKVELIQLSKEVCVVDEILHFVDPTNPFGK